MDKGRIPSTLYDLAQRSLCRAFSMGYEPILVEDAHSTMNYDDAALSAAQIIAHHTNVLRGYAKILPADEIVFG